MQIKNIVATIASLAVSSAIAGPVAEPAANEFAQPAIEARAEAGSIKDLHGRYADKLHKNYVKNYVQDPTTPKPSLNDLLELKKQSEQTPATNLDKRGYSYDWSYSWRNRRFKNGCQLFFPFSIYGHHFNYDLRDYYRCFGVYRDCDGDGYADGYRCDCDYDYCDDDW